ncbi:MAG TPA: right-handed parallel beta-helix repeat-containing protein, partial [Acidimicrobiales bacterium]|nr:right-handed parallel beta-helix repeat-containing protein [Acidimicrobiales bacterium]
MLGGATPAAAETLVVTEEGNQGPDTLRDVLARAGDGDVITFSPELIGVFDPVIQIYLYGTPLTIEDSVTIQGPGREAIQIALYGDGIVIPDAGDEVVIEGVSLVGGSTAGCIASNGELTLRSSTLTDCYRPADAGVVLLGDTVLDRVAVTGGQGAFGAVRAMGDLTVLGSAFSSNGRSVVASGDVTVSHSTFAGSGSALEASGPSTRITDSTIVGHDGTADDLAAAVVINGSSATVERTTISGNTADLAGGILVQGGNLTLESSIVADNVGATTGDVLLNASTITARSTLLEDPGATALLAGVDGNIIGEDPLLEPFADAGGWTYSVVPGIGSPVLDQGDAGDATTDVRGFAREFGAGADMGATERDAGPVLEVWSTAMDGVGSLVQIVDDANDAGLPATITFDSTVTGTIRLASTLYAQVDMTLEGPGADELALSGSDIRRLVNASSAAFHASDLTMVDGHIVPGTVSGGNTGAAILSGPYDLTLQRMVFDSNTANSGGAVYGVFGSIEVDDSTFVGNSATSFAGRGGAIVMVQGALDIDGTTIADNTGRSGGAIAATMSDVDITSSTISSNTGVDGTLMFVSSDITIAHSTITGNEDPTGAVVGYVFGPPGSELLLQLDHTIVGGTTGGGADVYLEHPLDTTATATWSLIEDPGTSGFDETGNNIIGVGPDLGVLADNGGSTSTHLPNETSRALDAGDPNITGAP